MEKLILQKMAKVMGEIGAIHKDQKNSAQSYMFRGIDQFQNALYPLLVRNGIIISPKVLSYTQELKEVTRGSGKTGIDKHVSILMEYVFWSTEDGSQFTVGPIPAEGLDSGDKATGKALSAAMKYALIQTFSIPTQDMSEADLESPEIKHEVKPAQNTTPEQLNTGREIWPEEYSMDIPTPPPPPGLISAPADPVDVVSPKQAGRMYGISKSSGWSANQLSEYLWKECKVKRTDEVPKSQYNRLCEFIEKNIK